MPVPCLVSSAVRCAATQRRKRKFSHGRFPANAHPPGLGLSCPQPDPDHPAPWVRFLAPRTPALDVRLPTALQVLQVHQVLSSSSHKRTTPGPKSHRDSHATRSPREGGAKTLSRALLLRPLDTTDMRYSLNYQLVILLISRPSHGDHWPRPRALDPLLVFWRPSVLGLLLLLKPRGRLPRQHE